MITGNFRSLIETRPFFTSACDIQLSHLEHAEVRERETDWRQMFSSSEAFSSLDQQLKMMTTDAGLLLLICQKRNVYYSINQLNARA